MVTKERRIQFNIVLILFPLVLFFILEIFLRFMGYGDKSKLFFVPRYVPEIYLENIQGYNKYVDEKLQSHSDKIENHIRNVMLVNKKEGTLRGFALGESAIQGFPYNSNHSFSKIMETAFVETGRYSHVEVMNMGISAISTYSVRDIAKKVLDYDPDFLLIYAGNNEYYGTLSHITGGNHFTRNLYVKLYEFRLFQLVKDFLSLFSKKPERPDQFNMMTECFQQTYMPKNEETDKLVAGNYIKNIEAIVRMCAKKEIPVIVVEPVCNLIDMAPFKGEEDNNIAENLIKIDRLIDSGNIQKADSLLEFLKKKYDKNANVNFLEAKLDRAKNGTISLEKYIKAKNNDIVPFRPREELISELKMLYTSKKEEYKNLYFVPLREKLTAYYGDSILGNSIFIDHVHFNQHGHKIISEIVSNEVATIFHFEPNEMDSLHLFFENETAVFQAIYSLPMYRLNANKVVKGMTEQPPFNDMVFPYEFDPKEFTQAVSDMGTEIVNRILPLDRYDSFFHTTRYYINKMDYLTAHEYFLADRFVFPGSYYRYLNLGKFLQMFEHYLIEAEMAYKQACLLSEKKSDIYEEFMLFLQETNQFEKAKEFQDRYGKPRD